MSDVTYQEMGAFKKKLKEMDPRHGEGFKPDAFPVKKKRDRPYVPEKAEVFPDWMGSEPGTHPRLPLKPPGR